MKSPINIVIADSQPIYRSGLRKLLESVKRFKVVGEAVDCDTALEEIVDKEPDVAILAIDLPEKKDGFEVARALLSKSFRVNVIFLTAHKSKPYFDAAMNLGAKGYILKYSATREVVDAVIAVFNGKSYICPLLSNYLLSRNRRIKSFADRNPAITSLTPCERRILALVGQSMTSKNIASQLCISVRTVEHHRENIASKLGLHGSHALLTFAIENKSELSEGHSIP